MAQITVTLSDDLQHFVEGQVDDGGYGDAGDYIARLLLRAKEGKQRLEALLIEGLDSGESVVLDDDEWKRIRSEVHERLTE